MLFDKGVHIGKCLGYYKMPQNREHQKFERDNLLLSKTENIKTCTSSRTPLFDTDKRTLTVYHGISLKSQVSLLLDLYRYLEVLPHREFLPPPPPTQVCPKNRCRCKIGRENVKTDNGLKSSLDLYVVCWIFCRRRHTENSSVEISRGTLNVMLVLMLSWDWDAAQVMKAGFFLNFLFSFVIEDICPETLFLLTST